MCVDPDYHSFRESGLCIKVKISGTTAVVTKSSSQVCFRYTDSIWNINAVHKNYIVKGQSNKEEFFHDTVKWKW